MGQSMDLCLCLATVGGNDEEDTRSMDKFKMYTIDCLDVSSLPQLITARVRPANEILKCPVTGKTCMHYHMVAEELVTTSNNDKKAPTKQWVYRFSESKSVDFYLSDPHSPDVTVLVPGKNVEIKRHAMMEGGREKNSTNTIDDPTKLIFSQNQSIPKGIQAIATAKKFNLYQPSSLFHFVRRAKKEMRYSLFSIEMNEQIAMLAVVVDRKGPNGVKGKILSPIGKDTLSPEYFQQYSWSESDRLSWAALTGDSRCVLATKDPKIFQSTYVDSTNYTIADLCPTYPQSPSRIPVAPTN